MGKLLFEKKFRDSNYQVFDQKLNECFYLKQIHSTQLTHISPKSYQTQADGFIFKDLKENIAIVTADCMPVYIQGKKGSIFLHAGWRGLANGILTQESIKEIIPTSTFIGPHIKDCCYEVGEEFKKNFLEKTSFKEKNLIVFFSLYEEAKKELKKTFPTIKIDEAKICTCCNKEFHSYRRNATTERNWNILSPLQNKN